MKIIHFKEINSTNTYLKENYKRLDNLTVVVADHQTSGKGRLGRTWIDNDDLLFSILIKEKLEKATDYSLLIASTLLKVFRDLDASVKWPNDIMINDKKVCGILLEAVSDETIKCVIIGVGINFNTEVFPEELMTKASSLKIITNKKVDKKKLLEEVVDRFKCEFEEYKKEGLDYLNNIKDHFYLSNKVVSFDYENMRQEGTVLGLNNDGSIIIKINQKIVNLSSGEVTFEKIYQK